MDILSKQQTIIDWLHTDFEGDYSIEFTETNEILIKGNILLINYKLKELPYKFKRVDGNFLIGGHKFPSNNRAKNHSLVSLKNCPEIITGDFNCSLCDNLTSLKYGPESVYGNYYCHNTAIKTLNGIATNIGKSIILYCNNNLINIEALLTIEEIKSVDLTGLQSFIYGSDVYQMLYNQLKLMLYDYSINRYDYLLLQEKYKEINKLV